MDLEQLRYFEAIARLGTVSAAADEVHVSQPALSRSLARLERELGHPLFERMGRRLTLGAVGAVALEHARAILREGRALRLAVDDAARRSRALRLGTVAPAPLWRLTALTIERFPGRLMTSAMIAEEEVTAGVLDGTLDLGISLRPHQHARVRSVPLMTENLAVVLPKSHALADLDAVDAAQLDGETFLLLADIGFWRQVVTDLLPASEFVVQEDRALFEQLVATTDLPHFITDAPSIAPPTAGRTAVALSDDAAHVTFYLHCRDTACPSAQEIFDWVRSRGQ